MPLLSPQPNEVYVVRSYKQFESNIWANNYEIQVLDQNVTTAGLRQAALNIVNAERQFHYGYIEFFKHVISTYQPDSRPYDPLTFISEVTSFQGLRAFPGDGSELPLTACVFVRLTSVSGRPGKRFYRGCISEGDVTFGISGNALSSSFRNQVESALSPLVASVAPGIGLVLASGTPQPTSIRPVVGISVARFTVNKKLSNAYFDRR
ncbi:hypothetical protein EI020_24005 [Escherichia coli]|uniref:hypothetical protein n=1 Tax=Escherichia coli TaxID=562 RepID=UPI00128EAE5B|nr:hypothetical protein [Escherichia coli]MQJ21673.1 hypothetical protein [Escherichia coli]MQK95047.1 hypothetical protein [Escherichia coli]MQL46363.1 hypothetical protein [Escherichia coli]